MKGELEEVTSEWMKFHLDKKLEISWNQNWTLLSSPHTQQFQCGVCTFKHHTEFQSLCIYVDGTIQHIVGISTLTFNVCQLLELAIGINIIAIIIIVWIAISNIWIIVARWRSHIESGLFLLDELLVRLLVDVINPSNTFYLLFLGRIGQWGSEEMEEEISIKIYTFWEEFNLDSMVDFRCCRCCTRLARWVRFSFT